MLSLAGVKLTVNDRLTRLRGHLTPYSLVTLLTVWFRKSLPQYLDLEPARHCAPLQLIADSYLRFYGQGLNCGLEDVRVLNSYLERHNISATTSAPLGETDLQLESALAAYSTDRKADLEAICELALNN